VQTVAPNVSKIGGIVVFFAYSASCLLFCWQSADVRFSNTDDVAFETAARSGRAEQYLINNAESQARFYFATPVYRHLLLSPYCIESPLVFSGVRGVLFYVQAGLLGWLAARLWGNAPLGAAVSFLIVSTLHIPATFFPVLSYFAMSAGFVALLIALHSYLSWLRRGSPFAAVLAAVSLLFSCLSLELFALFLPAFAFLAWTERGQKWSSAVAALLAPAVVVVLFLATYAAFAREFRSSYPGTQITFDPAAAAGILFRQLVGVIPGFEMVVHRLPEGHSGPLFRPLAEILADISMGGEELCIGLAHGILTVWLIRAAWRKRSRPIASDWPALIILGMLANLPLLFSVKYQTFIFQRQFPYIYAFYSFCLFAWAFAAIMVWLADYTPRLRRVLASAVSISIIALCVSAQLSNARTLAALKSKYGEMGQQSASPGAPRP
jgi:hypothetical protein